jgi:hypothetical protein
MGLKDSLWPRIFIIPLLCFNCLRYQPIDRLCKLPVWATKILRLLINVLYLFIRPPQALVFCPHKLQRLLIILASSIYLTLSPSHQISLNGVADMEAAALRGRILATLDADADTRRRAELELKSVSILRTRTLRAIC